MLGLGDPFTAHLELEHVGIPGHEKLLPAPWVAARLAPATSRLSLADLAPPRFGAPDAPADAPTRAEVDRFDADVRWARATLRCDRLRELERSYTEPLTFGRFFGNIVDSVSNLTLRIPDDPREAHRRFCTR
jgi:hypothetical protein